MNLKAISVATALALATVSLAPVAFAASTTTTTTTTTATKPVTKPVMKPAATPDPKRFKTEADAAKSCPTDTVVWVNLKSKIFHLQGTATYGKGKNGVYMCELDAKGEKFVPTKKPEKVMTTTTTTTTTKATTMAPAKK